ncbi:hypothetical protein [Flavobacterium cerinum]|uniref:Uncharacterized protein n=1 Tax=Flavobacterium cerinum TaxID=2502784 RepID=A0ABY5IRC6_9FLAO|nr:hypothetical protein [Flavobacterium cerinum]UUC45194.1 hypothetical protein NOX80_16405 [Flavobacterium cerinum]
MPKIKCNCGNIIGLGGIPDPNQYLVISDVEYDHFSGMVDAEAIYMKMKIIIECKSCKRLHIFWDGFDKESTTYSLQEK